MSDMDDDVVIVAAKRTPIGVMQGNLSGISAPNLAAVTIKDILATNEISPDIVDEVILGCVLSSGIGQAPARQAARYAQLSDYIPATTINKMCGSGMQSIIMGANAIKAGEANCLITGGMENMSQAPYLLPKARTGYRLGHDAIKDSMFLDGLEDIYEPGTLMGVFADRTAEHLEISRDAQDEFSELSLNRALQAQKNNYFSSEISPVTVKTKRDSYIMDIDESPNPEKLTKIRRLRPAFSTTGTVTAANASSISDGASTLLITKRSCAKKNNMPILATINATSSHAQAPEWFTTAPIPAVKKVLEKANWSAKEVDLYEINEAFAVVALAAIHGLSIPKDKVNVHGGACALGHPIGASGARIVTTLIYALKEHGLKKGVATACIGGGEATAIALTVE